MLNGLCSSNVALFLTVPLETNYLRIYWTDLYQMFRTYTHMGGHNQSDLFAIATQAFLW